MRSSKKIPIDDMIKKSSIQSKNSNDDDSKYPLKLWDLVRVMELQKAVVFYILSGSLH
jgi:hypothetical protein